MYAISMALRVRPIDIVVVTMRIGRVTERVVEGYDIVNCLVGGTTVQRYASDIEDDGIVDYDRLSGIAVDTGGIGAGTDVSIDLIAFDPRCTIIQDADPGPVFGSIVSDDIIGDLGCTGTGADHTNSATRS